MDFGMLDTFHAKGNKQHKSRKVPTNFRVPIVISRLEKIPSTTRIEASDAADEEYYDFDEKHISYKRFKRNDFLMREVMSSEIVPSASLPVTSAKLQKMQIQVEALDECQHKEVAELVEVEKKHIAILAEMKRQKESFDIMNRKLSRPITSAQIKRFSDCMYERLRKRLLEKICQQREEEQAKALADQNQAKMDATFLHSDGQACMEKGLEPKSTAVSLLEEFSHAN